MKIIKTNHKQIIKVIKIHAHHKHREIRQIMKRHENIQNHKQT